jgi:hypothetical protein
MIMVVVVVVVTMMMMMMLMIMQLSSTVEASVARVGELTSLVEEEADRRQKAEAALKTGEVLGSMLEPRNTSHRALFALEALSGDSRL